MWNRKPEAGNVRPNAPAPRWDTQPDQRDEMDALPCRDTERMGRLLRRLEPRLTAVALRLTRVPDVAYDMLERCAPRARPIVRGGSVPARLC